MLGLKLGNEKQQVSEIEEIGRREIELTAKRKAKAAELARAESAAGEAYLTGSSGDGAVDEALRSRAELAAIDYALGVLRTKRPEIIRAGFLAEAKALGARVAEKTADLQKLHEKRRGPLAQLLEMEGCEFMAAGTPRSSLLRAEIAELTRAQRELEKKPVPDSGTIDLESVTSNEAVLMAVLTFPALCPTVSEVVGWLEGCEASARKHRAADFGSHPRRVRISWNAEGIKSDSCIFCAVLAATRKGNFADSPEAIDVSSATFRPCVVPIRTGDAQAAGQERIREGYPSERRA